MTDDEIWKMRGIYAQICAAERDIVFALAEHKFSANRKRDLVRNLQYIVEQIEAD